MKEGEERIYRNRKIYFNQWGEFCVSHLWGGMVSYNAGFPTLKQAMRYIDLIVVRNDLSKDDFEQIAREVKTVNNSPLQHTLG